jgi:hypothetical protein
MREFMLRLNGWVKIFATALLAAIIPVVIGFVSVGQTIRQVDVNTQRLAVVEKHIIEYTPNVYKEFADTKAKVAVCETRIENMDKLLNDLKTQNAEIIKILRSRKANIER